MHAIVMRTCCASQNGTSDQAQRGPDTRDECNGSTKSDSFAILFSIQELALQCLHREPDTGGVESLDCNPVGMGVADIDPQDLGVAMEVNRPGTVMRDMAPLRRSITAVYVSRVIHKQFGKQALLTVNFGWLKRNSETIEMPITHTLVD